MSKKADSIVSEIREKITDYEDNMRNFFSEWNDTSNRFTMRQDTKKSNSYSKGRTADTHNAINTLTSFMYKGLTSADPFFEVQPMDIIGQIDPSVLTKVERTIKTQLDYSRYKQNLYISCQQAVAMGTCIVQEPFYDVKVNSLGRKLPVTGFKPRSLLTTYLDRNAVDPADSDFIINIDLVTKNHVMNLPKTDPIGDRFITSAIDKVVKDESPMDWPEEVRKRLNDSGYTDDNMKGYRELATYSGKLDCLCDGLEYIAIVGNRTELIAFYSNPNQTGMRPFKVHRYIPWEMELLGYGVGLLLGSLQTSLDNNRRMTHDRVSVATMGIGLINKFAQISPSSLAYTKDHLISTEDTSAIIPLPIDYNAITSGFSLEEKLSAELKAASGATDTLQAITTDATATEVSLAQNSAVRNQSVRVELFAEDIVKPHLEYMHDNNSRNLAYPFVISGSDGPITVYPNDMLVDVDFRIKTVTDKDFRPQRQRNQLDLLQILSSTKNILPPEIQSIVGPTAEAIVKDFAKSMDLDIAQLKNNSGSMGLPMGQDLANSGVMAGMQAAQIGNLEGIQNGIQQRGQGSY